MAPTYSPMMPMKTIWMDMRKKMPMSMGATPTENVVPVDELGDAGSLNAMRKKASSAEEAGEDGEAQRDFRCADNAQHGNVV